jgi:glutathione synthase/RimK-type ligase-like ATP-grasp enzyme
MWHWDYENYKDNLFARQLLIALNELKILVFPDFWTTFLFDDKLGQKYLFESLEIPSPQTYVFYERDKAFQWSKTAKYPIVFKLRCGAGAQNVQLVRSASNAKKLITKAFSSGYSRKNKWGIIKDRYIKLTRDKTSISFVGLINSIYQYFIPKIDQRIIPKEIGYIMFQEFLPNNDFDIRLIVLGNRCFGIKRYNRKNDFRASGSGFIDYNVDKIDIRSVKLSFEIASKFKTSLLALDYLFDRQNNPVVTEFSFGFAVEAYDSCIGYWDNDLIWHDGKQNLQYLMVEDLLTKIKSKK